MDAIAAAAGVSKPVVYSCFRDRAELVRALFIREERRLSAHAVASLPERVPVGDVELGMRTAFAAFLSAVAAAPDSWRLILLSEHAGQPEVQRRVVRGRRKQVERVTGLVAAQLRAAGLTEAERKAEAVASTMVAAGEAAATLVVTSPGRWQPDELADLVARLFVRGWDGL